MTAFSLINTFTTAQNLINKNITKFKGIRHLRPNTINHSLTRRTLYEPLRFANNSHLNCIPDPLFQITIPLLPCACDNIIVRSWIHRPTCCYGQGQLQHTICVVSQCANGQNLAKLSTGAGDGGGGHVFVPDEVDTGEEEAEYDGHISVALNCTVFFDQGSDKRIV